jgi:hypothetical protein
MGVRRRWISLFCVVLSAATLFARPAAASAAGCLDQIICARCVCDPLKGLCECTLCFTDCVLLLF